MKCINCTNFCSLIHIISLKNTTPKVQIKEIYHNKLVGFYAKLHLVMSSLSFVMSSAVETPYTPFTNKLISSLSLVMSSAVETPYTPFTYSASTLPYLPYG